MSGSGDNWDTSGAVSLAARNPLPVMFEAAAARVVAVDLGGTHARFAIAELHGDRRPTLGRCHTYKTANFPGLAAAWAAFERETGGDVPRAASIAIAGPIDSEVIRLTNNGWTLRPDTLGEELRLDQPPVLLNDFAAMAAAVDVLDESELAFVGGRPGRLPDHGVTTVIGPGTGLGVAQLLRGGDRHTVLATEGGHLDFSALDSFEERLLQRLRAKYGRVSSERVVSGPALAIIRKLIAHIDGETIPAFDDAAVWASAIDGRDPHGQLALERFVMAFGSVAGDLALAHGSNAVVLAGQLSSRILAWLQGPLFNDRFKAKGRFSRRMAEIPIRLAVHSDLGLLGAAAACQERWRASS